MSDLPTSYNETPPSPEKINAWLDILARLPARVAYHGLALGVVAFTGAAVVAVGGVAAAPILALPALNAGYTYIFNWIERRALEPNRDISDREVSDFENIVSQTEIAPLLKSREFLFYLWKLQKHLDENHLLMLDAFLNKLALIDSKLNDLPRALAEEVNRLLRQILHEELSPIVQILAGMASDLALAVGGIHREPPRTAPFMIESLRGIVQRPAIMKELHDHFIDPVTKQPRAAIVALVGAGGFGKTTLAKAFCHESEVRAAFSDGVLLIELGEKVDNLYSKVDGLIYELTGKASGAPDLNTAADRLDKLLAERDIVLMIDDVWEQSHLRPFLRGSGRCARLITCRDHDVLPREYQIPKIQVGSMELSESIQLLCSHLPEGENLRLRKIADRMGRWALLLSMANGFLHDHLEKDGSLLRALTSLEDRLNAKGLLGLDPMNLQARHEAVSKTLEVSLERLEPRLRQRFRELAIFPEESEIPFAALKRLWGNSSGLLKSEQIDEIDIDLFCLRLGKLSLLLSVHLGQLTIRLHNIIRQYLIDSTENPVLTALHSRFLDSYGVDTWTELPEDELYLWDHLATHLRMAGRGDELMATAKDLRYLVNKTWLRSAYAVESDLAEVLKIAPNDAMLRILKRAFGNMVHFIGECESREELAATLHSRLQHLPELANSLPTLPMSTSRLVPWHPMPDLPQPSLIRILAGHRESIKACAVSPDSRFIISAASGSWRSDYTLKVWDAENGQERFTLLGHSSSVTDCAVSPDGRFIVSASADNTLKVWDAENGQERFTLLGHSKPVLGCAMSPDGRFIVSTSADGTLKAWDAESGQLRHTLQGHSHYVTSCAVSPDGRFIISTSRDGTLKIWDAASWAEHLTLRGHLDWVVDCAVSPDGTFIVSTSRDGTLKVWDIESGQVRHSLRGHTESVLGCAVSPDGTFIVSAAGDRTLKVWDAENGQERFTLTGHSREVNGCAVSPDGRFIVSASGDRTLKVWDTAKSRYLPTAQGHSESVWSCAFSPDGRFIISASLDKSLKVWDTSSGTEQFTLRGHAGDVLDCAANLDGTFIVSASQDHTLKVWDTASGVERHTLQGHSASVLGCKVSPDGRFIVSASADGTLKVWDADNGQEQRTLQGHSEPVWGCAVSPDGHFIVSASADGTLKVWDADNGQEQRTLQGHSDRVWSCAVSPDSRFIVSASDDWTLKVWEVTSGIECRTLRGHRNEVAGCAISPDGVFILSVSKDHTVRVWSLTEGRCLAVLHVDGWLYNCAWHPDSEHLVAVGKMGVYWLRFVRGEGVG